MSSSTPPGSPEYLDPSAGDPVASPRPSGAGRRRGLLVGGALAAAVLAGGTAYGAWWYFSSGAQPAEALPASTVGYVAVDLDPSGQQLLAARETLEKFPAWREQDISDRGDLREWVVEQVSEGSDCDLDYAADVEPWLGDRLAIAAVDAGDDAPTPVLVVQVTDADAADEGIGALAACGDGESGGWAISGGWAVVAETDEIAEGVQADAAESSLADDEDFARWTGEAGDAGIVSMYAAPEAAALLEDAATASGTFGASAWSDTDQNGNGTSGESVEPMPEELQGLLDDFEGMAGTVRFADGSLELEVATGMGESTQEAGTTGGDAIATLPEDTVAALGMGLAEGWFSQLVDSMATYSGGEMTAEQLLEEMASASGLDLPADAETLLGESAAIAVGPGLDPEVLANSADPSQVPVAAKVQGDPDAIEAVIAKITDRLGPQAAELLATETTDDGVAVGPDPDYVADVAGAGTLGESTTFTDVVGDIDNAAFVFFLDLDSLGGMVEPLVGGDPEVSENLEPLAAFGMTAWLDGTVSHAVARLTTD